MQPNNQVMEQITIRRANLVDADKVRYRVYTSPTEFVAVIAESALMAVKVSGISTPHKIMRDLPTDGIAIEAKKMMAQEEKPMRVAFPLEKPKESSKSQTQMPSPADVKTTPFVAMGIADLQHKGGVRARILPPEMVHEIIEEHAKAAVAAPSTIEPAPAPIVQAAPEPVAMTEMDVINTPPTQELSQAEKIVKMAEETLPPSTAGASPAAGGEELQPDEVAKLLNE